MSLFVNLNLNQIHALKVRDKPLDPFNRSAELFQTYSISELEPLGGVAASEVSAGDKKAKAVDVAAAKEEAKKDEVTPAKPGEVKAAWMRLGFSTSGAPGSGVAFKKDEIKQVIDPLMTFGAPRDLAEGQTRRFRFDVHWWEADGSSDARNVRAAFSDSNLSALVKAYEAAGEDGRQAKERVLSWLTQNKDEALTKALATAGTGAAPWIEVGLALRPVLGLLFSVIHGLVGGVDAIASEALLLSMKNDHGQLAWRLIDLRSDDLTGWTSGVGKQDLVTAVRSSNGKHHYVPTYKVRVID
jgi:hypothetical protein